MSPCLDDQIRDPARAGLLSSKERRALLSQVVALLFALGAPAGGDRFLTVKGNRTSRNGRPCKVG
jgi:hypothetical protein